LTARNRIVCIGEALVDLTPPPGRSVSNASTLQARLGGAPLNVAMHLRRAGAKPSFLGTLSNDGFGDRIRAELARKKIPHLPLGPVEAPTRLAVIDQSDVQPPFRFYGQRPADTRLSIRDVRKEIVPGVNAVYVSSLMMIDKRAARVQMDAIRIAIELGDVLVVTDPNPRRSAWSDQDAMILATERLLAHSWLTKISLDDARELGWPDNPKDLLSHLEQRTGGYSIVTDGARGCWLASNTGVEHFSVPAADVVDSTGAGDAFFARIIANALRDWALTPETIMQAAYEGARAAGKRGAF
jgi:fructokinase